MKHKRLRLSALLVLAIGLTGLKAQETIPATGGNASGSGGSVSYSVGQVVYTTYTGTNGTLSQGVQQPFEISVVTAIEVAKVISLNCTAFPNPTTNYLTLKVDSSVSLSARSSSYQMYDISGKLLENKKITGIETSISMNDLVPATYFLKVTFNNKVIKIFKIIKN